LPRALPICKDSERRLPAADFPAAPGYRRDLGRAHASLASVLTQIVKPDEAKDEYLRAIAIAEQLAADFPDVPEYAVELGADYGTLGSRIKEAGAPAEALNWYRKAIQTLARTVERASELVRARELLRNSHSNRAMALEQFGRFAESVADWDAAIDLDGGRTITWRMCPAISLARSGQTVKAVAEAESAAAVPEVSTLGLYIGACAFALASAAEGVEAPKERYARRAVELLAEADVGGWFGRTDQMQHLRIDRDLDALRSRPDFLALLARAEAAFAARGEAKIAFAKAPATRPAAPSNGKPASIPGVVQAEDFDTGGEGVGYHDTDPNDPGTDQPHRPYEAPSIDACFDEGGGHNVGGIFVGEWLAYSVDVTEAGECVIDLRVSSPGGGGTLHVEFDNDIRTSALTAPDTGTWQRWHTVSTTNQTVRLKAGRQLMRVVFDTAGGVGWANRNVCNVNWIEIRRAPAAQAASARADAGRSPNKVQGIAPRPASQPKTVSSDPQ
jgi:tetratricopeptide (TPR) repeat protein